MMPASRMMKPGTAAQRNILRFAAYGTSASNSCWESCRTLSRSGQAVKRRHAGLLHLLSPGGVAIPMGVYFWHPDLCILRTLQDQDSYFICVCAWFLHTYGHDSGEYIINRISVEILEPLLSPNDRMPYQQQEYLHPRYISQQAYWRRCIITKAV